MIRYIFLCFAFILISSPATLRAEINTDGRILDIQQVTSDQGITAWLVEDHSLPIIAMRFSFTGAGAAGDPADKQGLSNMVATMLDQGAGDYDSQTFQLLLDDHNITLGFGAGRDDFGGSLKMLRHHQDLAFDLLRLALTKPRFDEEPLERMRNAALSRIRNSLSNPRWIAARIMNDTVFDGHPYALNAGGTLQTIGRIDDAAMRDVVEKRLGRDNLVISIVGAISADEVKDRLDALFGDLPAQAELTPAETIKLQNQGKTVLYEHDIPQTIIQIIQPGIARDDPDYYKAAIMNFILGGSGFGSRLTEEIREKRGLTYGISSGFFNLEHAKAFQISTSTQNDNVADMLTLIRAEIDMMRDTEPAKEEVADAKAYLIGSLPLRLASTDSIAGLIQNMQLDHLPPDYLDRRAAKLDAVTVQDVQYIARKMLAPDALTTILVGRPGNITPSVIIETLPHVE